MKLLLTVALALSISGTDTLEQSGSAVHRTLHLQVLASQKAVSARRTERKELRTKNKSHSPAGKYSQATIVFGIPPPPKVSSGSEAPTTRKSRV